MNFYKLIGAVASTVCAVMVVCSASAMAAEKTKTWDLTTLEGESFNSESYTAVSDDDNIVSIKSGSQYISADGVTVTKSNNVKIKFTALEDGDLTVTFKGEGTVVASPNEERGGSDPQLTSGAVFKVTEGETYYLQGAASDTAVISKIGYTYEVSDETELDLTTISNVDINSTSYTAVEENDNVKFEIRAAQDRFSERGMEVYKNGTQEDKPRIKVTPAVSGTLTVEFDGSVVVTDNYEDRNGSEQAAVSGGGIAVEAGHAYYIQGSSGTSGHVTKVVFTPGTTEPDPEPEPEFVYAVSDAVTAEGDDGSKATGFTVEVKNNGGEKTFNTLTWTVTSNHQEGISEYKTTTCTVDGGGVIFGLIVNGLYDEDATAEVSASATQLD